MASPASAASQKLPQLSYADRAKKARNIQTQNSPSVQRAHSQTVSASSTVTALSSAPSTSSTTSTAVSPSDPPKPSQPVDARERHPATSTSNVLKVASSSSPTRTDTARKDIQSDVKADHADPSILDTPPARPQKTAPPPVNVWKVREEQRVQRSQSQTQVVVPPSVQLSAPIDTLDKTFPSLHSRPPDTPSVPATPTAPIPNIAPVATKPTLSQKPPVNGHHHPEDQGDPFVVRPHLALPVRLPLSVADADNWPTIGDAAPVPPRPPSHGTSDAQDHDLGDQVEKSEEKSPGGTAPKKGEKPKWVPIPPEELRAAHDAQQPRHRHHPNGHSRTRSQYKSHAPASGSTSTTGSISGQISQGQSRTHSAMGTRQPGSHVGSVSHSQAQSRTGSAHSSPRQLGRGGRRLPEDLNSSKLPVPSIVSGVVTSSKSSRATSPQPQGRPHQASYEDLTSVTHTSSVLHSEPNAPEPLAQHFNSSFPEASHTPPYYTSMPPPLSSNTSQSYHSTHAPNSPTSNPYSLSVSAPVPPMYPLPSTIPTALAGHPPYPGNPPYALYPPYEYTYNPHYMHWPQGPDNIGPYPLPPHTQGYVVDIKQAQEGPPPTSSASRPPPPPESDPIAGHRDMGFILPPPAAYAAPEGADQVRGRRARELSFGSIQPTVSGKPHSPASSPGALEYEKEVDNQGGLGLDVGVPEEGKEGELGLERSFASFSIGVAPGDPGPSRIRSRTRTQPKATPVTRERVRTAPGDLGGGPFNASKEEQLEGVAISHEPSTLVVEPSKWEFGTANLPDYNEQLANSSIGNVHPQVRGMRESPTPGLGPGVGFVAVPQPLVEVQPQRQLPYAQRMGLAPLSTPGGGLQASHSPSSASAPYSVSTGVSPAGQGESIQGFEVRDYGWGFGQQNGVAVGPVVPREEQRPPRDREPREFQRDVGGSRPRRGSYGGGYGFDNRGGHERGGFTPRRGRGANAGYNRGYHGRNFSRGGYQQQSHQARPSFTMNQTPPMPNPDPNPYYTAAPQTPLGTTYFHPAGYDPYAFAPYPTMPAVPAPPQTAPLPVPQTPTSFPLDPMRYYLLGQLEYYLSAQNLAQDIFLRKQMDNRGWIHIPVIAAFPRVRNLTQDLQLMKDVMAISSLVEVHEDWVRARDWRPFVLPAAPETVVGDAPYDLSSRMEGTLDGSHQTEDHGDAESTSPEGEDEDEEEEVEIVLDGNVNQSWAAHSG